MTKIILTELTKLPKPDPGATLPIVMADDDILLLIYRGNQEEETPAVLVEFEMPYMHKFGAPNDETLSGHPLYELGLTNNSVFEVSKSAWIEELEKMNAVHPNHDPRRFDKLHHYIFAFHDNTFECIAESLSVEMKKGDPKTVLRGILK